MNTHRIASVPTLYRRTSDTSYRSHSGHMQRTRLPPSRGKWLCAWGAFAAPSETLQLLIKQHALVHQMGQISINQPIQSRQAQAVVLSLGSRSGPMSLSGWWRMRLGDSFNHSGDVSCPQCSKTSKRQQETDKTKRMGPSCHAAKLSDWDLWWCLERKSGQLCWWSSALRTRPIRKPFPRAHWSHDPLLTPGQLEEVWRPKKVETWELNEIETRVQP